MGVSSPMSKTRLNQGSEKKWQDCSNVSKKIEKKGIKGSLKYYANGPIGVRSAMSKTKPKQDIEENRGIAPMCSKPLRSKTFKELWDIASIGQ